jgi:hypothetical protein
MEMPDPRLDRIRVPARAAIAPALDEALATLPRVAQQGLDGELEGALDAPIDPQTVPLRIDGRHTVVVTLEVQGIRRNGPVQVVQRRPRDPVAGQVRIGGDPADDTLLESGRLAIIRKGSTRLPHPGWGACVGRGRCGLRADARCEERRPADGQTRRDEAATSCPSDALWGGRLVPLRIPIRAQRSIPVRRADLGDRRAGFVPDGTGPGACRSRTRQASQASPYFGTTIAAAPRRVGARHGKARRPPCCSGALDRDQVAWP